MFHRNHQPLFSLSSGGGATRKNPSKAKEEVLDASTSSQPAEHNTPTVPPQNEAVFIVEADVRDGEAPDAEVKPAGVSGTAVTL